MEPTRIPKSFLKPPSKIVKTATSLITQTKPSTSASTSNGLDKLPPRAAVLRRRSKSVSDLKALYTKPSTITTRPNKPVEKAALLRTGQKRPALQKIDEENKPKISKVKIPDWDYKSRFQELQKRHTVLQEELKKAKSKCSGFLKLDEEVTVLREQKQKSQETIDLLYKNETVLKNKVGNLVEENSTVKTNLAEKEQAFETLKSAHGTLTEENGKNLERIRILEEELRNSARQITDLQTECVRLKSLTQDLREDLEKHENLRRTLHNTIQDMKGNIRVFCRVRPPVTNEEKDRQLCAIFVPNESTLEIKKCKESISAFSGKLMDLKQEFTFDRVFSSEANQAEVFEELSQLVQSALDGYHVCVFAYGQTGSGKTYTMQGSPEDYGMIPRTIDLIFEKIKMLARAEWGYTVTANFLEIYNEVVRDLLVPNSTSNCTVRYNEGRGVTVTNQLTMPITSAEELKALMDEAHKNRVVASTDFNEHSSRSHAVTKINLEGYNNVTKATYSGSINLVDLAGSESAKTSSAERMTETKNINKSLSTLGNVMLALHNKDSHVPYRDSKLTFLLQSCLGGNSKTLMFVNIAPFEECYGESLSSLRFASKVKEIKMTAKKNKSYLLSTPQQSKI